MNPWTGAYTFEGSHLDQPRHDHEPLEHRLRVYDKDIDPAEASYYLELYVPSADDTDHMNSIGWEPVEIDRVGSTWIFDIESTEATVGPAIEAWEGATRTVIPAELAEEPSPEEKEKLPDGRCILAAKATDNGDSTWHYEYALYNHDMDRQVRSFTIPLGAATAVSKVEFHSVTSHDDYSADPWQWDRESRSITWSTESHAGNPQANSLRWGTVYNFRFDADAEPAATTVTLGLFKPGEPAELRGETVGPFREPFDDPFKRGDTDGSGEVQLTDAISLLGFLFQGQDTPACLDAADGDDSGALDITDAVFVLGYLFLGTEAPPAPGPAECGPDPTPDEDEFPECVYSQDNC
jgi:hypothetical protein